MIDSVVLRQIWVVERDVQSELKYEILLSWAS